MATLIMEILNGTNPNSFGKQNVQGWNASAQGPSAVEADIISQHLCYTDV